MYYDHKAFFLDGCKICECFDGIVSCSDQTEVGNVYCREFMCSTVCNFISSMHAVMVKLVTL